MQKKEGKPKISRILDLYERLNKGEIIDKERLAIYNEVDEKTIQRDINDLNNYYLQSDPKASRAIIYNRKLKGYQMINKAGFKFADKDIFALSKIILESRAFSKQEMNRILDILNSNCEDNDSISKAIRNERFNYIPPKHGKNIIDFMWEISVSIKEKKLVQVKYERQDKQVKEYKLKPLGLVFSEYYFYLVGEVVGKEKNHPAVFRVDRFVKYEITEEKFSIPDRDRFEEGEFHKKIQFMYTGELMKIQFKFWGDSLEAILDRLPTSKIIRYDEKDNKPIIEAEVYGEGVKRWILSQKEFLEVLRPESYRQEIKETIKKMYELYN